MQVKCGGKLSNLEGDSIGHCEKGKFLRTCINSEWLPRYRQSNLQTSIR